MAETGMTDVECDSCGVRIGLDDSVVSVKHRLHKRVECPVCRNVRVSRELELLEIEFSGTLPEREETAARRLRTASAGQSFF